MTNQLWWAASPGCSAHMESAPAPRGETLCQACFYATTLAAHGPEQENTSSLPAQDLLACHLRLHAGVEDQLFVPQKLISLQCYAEHPAKVRNACNVHKLFHDLFLVQQPHGWIVLAVIGSRLGVLELALNGFWGSLK